LWYSNVNRKSKKGNVIMYYDIPDHAYHCSCCGDLIPRKDTHLILDTEGNYCQQCHDEIELRNHLQCLDMIALILDNLKNPFNRIDFMCKEFNEQMYYVIKLIEKGVLVWKIG